MIEFDCKNCGHKLSVQDQYSGERIKCPKCSDVCVVPDSSDKIKFHCKNCGKKISVPQIHAGKKGKCPKCKNPVLVPSLKRGPAEDLYQEETEEYEESESVDRRIIVGISAVAAVVVLGLIILVAVLRFSRSRPAERYEGLRDQQQVADTDSRPQPVTSGSRPVEEPEGQRGQQQVADTDSRPKPVTPDNALSDSFTWTYINVDIEIQENGDLLISEQQEYSFKAGPNEKRHELSRLFLMDRIDDIQDVEVYERTGSDETSSEPLSLTHRTVRDQNDLWICWSHELNPPETRTFLLKYRVIGGFRLRRRRRSRSQSMDELYWNAVIWPRPAVVEKVKVTVHLPSKLRGKIRKIGSYGAIAAIKPDTDLDTIEFNRIRPIPREKGLQIYLAFQHGILKIKTTKTNGPRWRDLWWLWLGLTIFPIMLIWSIVTGDWSIWEEKGLFGDTSY